MPEHEEHSHPQSEIPNHDDGPPDGYEADWLKWRSRMNRRRRFQRQAPTPRGQESPDTGVVGRLLDKLP